MDQICIKVYYKWILDYEWIYVSKNSMISYRNYVRHYSSLNGLQYLEGIENIIYSFLKITMNVQWDILFSKVLELTLYKKWQLNPGMVCLVELCSHI